MFVVKWSRRRLVKQYPWLESTHPLVRRDSRLQQRELPKLIRKISGPWTMLGYAAVIHGALFVASFVLYGNVAGGQANTAVPLLMPFLTPFGTPLAAALLHSVLYWTMMIGICNMTTFLVAREMEQNTWRLLRSTPYTVTDLLMSKLVVVGQIWLSIVRVLITVRLFALLAIPIFLVAQRSADLYPVGGPDWISVAVFMAQPLVDGFVVAALSMLTAVIVKSVYWSKIYAYGLVATVYGLLSGIGGFWLIYTSPLGVIAGLLVPLGHWAPLAAAVTPLSPSIPPFIHPALVAFTYFVAPIGIAIVALAASIRLAQHTD